MSAVTVTAIATLATAAGAIGTSIAQAKAASAQRKTTTEALSYEKARDQNARQQSANRYATLAGALGMPTTPTNAPTPVFPGGQGPLPMQSGTPPPPAHAVPRGGTTITMRAPDGSVKPVPANEEDHWTRLGATRVS